MKKVSFGKYDGKMDATAIHSWLHQFNAYFATRTMSSNNKVLLAAIYLAGDAINWYHVRQDEHLQAHAANMRLSLTGMNLPTVGSTFKKS